MHTCPRSPQDTARHALLNTLPRRLLQINIHWYIYARRTHHPRYTQVHVDPYSPFFISPHACTIHPRLARVASPERVASRSTWTSLTSDRIFSCVDSASTVLALLLQCWRWSVDLDATGVEYKTAGSCPQSSLCTNKVGRWR